MIKSRSNRIKPEPNKLSIDNKIGRTVRFLKLYLIVSRNNVVSFNYSRLLIMY